MVHTSEKKTEISWPFADDSLESFYHSSDVTSKAII